MMCRCVSSQAALSGWDGSRVLHWQNFEPGAFGGYVSNADNIFFDSKVYLPLTYYQGWCACECGLLSSYSVLATQSRIVMIDAHVVDWRACLNIANRQVLVSWPPCDCLGPCAQVLQR